jgi:CheY-like chemotaxis protein
VAKETVRPATLLVADDDEANRELFAELLRSKRGGKPWSGNCAVQWPRPS